VRASRIRHTAVSQKSEDLLARSPCISGLHINVIGESNRTAPPQPDRGIAATLRSEHYLEGKVFEMIREVLLDPHKLMERVGERAQVDDHRKTRLAQIAHELKP